MTKTQIQLPDPLYRRVKAFAKEREWSLAETFRRAAEQMLERYPSHPVAVDEWAPPVGRDLGWKELSAEQMHQAALDDMEPRLP